MKITAIALAIGFLAGPVLAADDTPIPPKFPSENSPEASLYRGRIVFANYCVLCHGVDADGKGRAAKLYTPKPANLVTSDKNRDYKELIVRQGGAALGRSEFMPPWNNELTKEQISDLLNYLTSIAKPKKD